MMKFQGMVIGVPKEIMKSENRIAATPDTVKKMVAEIKRDMRDPCPPVPTFGKAVSSFEAVKRYLCPYNIDDGSFGRPELLAIHHI
jgi:hypothetical protein